MAKATIRRKLKKRHPTSQFFGKREPVAAVCGKQVEAAAVIRSNDGVL